MAEHIESIRRSTIPLVSRAEFYARCRSGMAIFCEGRYLISEAIEDFTGSPFSHVATLIYLAAAGRWGVLEATKEHGVHIGHLEHYLGAYDGDIVLTATPSLKASDYRKLMAAQFELIDDRYDVHSELSMVAHKLLKFYPVRTGRKEYFCSGLYEQGRKATSVPLKWNGPGMATPEEVWTDPSVIPVCAVVKESKR